MPVFRTRLGSCLAFALWLSTPLCVFMYYFEKLKPSRREARDSSRHLEPGSGRASITDPQITTGIG